MQRVTAYWRQSNQRGDITAAIIALLPVTLLFITFNLYPLVYSGFLSFMEWDGFSTERTFVGLQNYQQLFSSPDFMKSLGVTLTYTLSVTLFSIVASLVIAVLLNTGIQGKTTYRVLYFLPVVTSTIAVAVVWRYLLTPNIGYVDIFLKYLGIASPSPTWLRNPTWALRIVIIVGIWKRLGFNIVIYLAGLQGIPQEYYEASQVDGASKIRQFRHITIPLIAPITLLLVIMSVIDSFLIFDVVYVMTNGGPLNSTEVIGLLLYNQAFRYFNMGEASAIAWVIFAIVFFVTLVQWRVFGMRGDKA